MSARLPLRPSQYNASFADVSKALWITEAVRRCVEQQICAKVGCRQRTASCLFPSPQRIPGRVSIERHHPQTGQTPTRSVASARGLLTLWDVSTCRRAQMSVQHRDLSFGCEVVQEAIGEVRERRPLERARLTVTVSPHGLFGALV